MSLMVVPMLQSERQGAGHQDTYLLTDLLPHEKPVRMGCHDASPAVIPMEDGPFGTCFPLFSIYGTKNIADISHQPTIHQSI
jgi:hypothetical protein